MTINIKPKDQCRWDLISLGEVMLRLDPGDGRVATTRQFQAWEGGGEYNVSRALKRCFGMSTAVVTALADNPIGRLIQDLIFQGGVAQDYIRWVEYDGVGRRVRNGLNFTERGFGVRAAVGCSDRGHTAASQLKKGDIDWGKLFLQDGARWFHTGGIFTALSETTPAVAAEAMQVARSAGTIVSYDLNYRPSLWNAIGGKAKSQEVNRMLASSVDVMFGNEEDFTAALGFNVAGVENQSAKLDQVNFKAMIQNVVQSFPQLHMVATTLRHARTATLNDWGAIAYAEGRFFSAPNRENLEIYDRVGGGDAFVSGFIYALLTGKDPQWAVDCGTAHGALAMCTPGDTSMATLPEVLQLMKGDSARIQR
jgi:2-dehydro-3-deoxygluconokinase